MALVRKTGRKEQLEDLGVDVRILLKYIFKKRDMGMTWNYMM
jgi:hypothetical protein